MREKVTRLSGKRKRKKKANTHPIELVSFLLLSPTYHNRRNIQRQGKKKLEQIIR
jgi:hypothetical protein